MDFSTEKYQMYDVHMHVIPGVDDGSWNIDMSITMIDMAFIQGIEKIIATPHSSAFDMGREGVLESFEELKRQIQKRIPWLGLCLGCEVYCRKENLQVVLNNLQEGIYPSMNGTKYVLTEFYPGIEPDEALLCSEALLSAGWIPIIAHVERYKFLFGSNDCMEEFKKRGAFLQINALSVLDEDNEEIKSNALGLVERRLADFLGSDAHRTNHRPPSVKYSLKYLFDNFDTEYVEKIAFRNAEELLLIK